VFKSETDKKTKDDLKTYSTAFNPNTDILTDQSILNLSHCNSELIRTSGSKSSVNYVLLESISEAFRSSLY